MFKLVVLFALVAVAVAKPGYYGHLEHAAPVVAVAPVYQKVIAPVAVPAAVSHSYRKDVISEPVVSTYAHAVPVVAKTVVAAPYAPYYGHAEAYGAYEGLHGLHGVHGLHGAHGLYGHDGLHGYGYHGHHW